MDLEVAVMNVYLLKVGVPLCMVISATAGTILIIALRTRLRI